MQKKAMVLVILCLVVLGATVAYSKDEERKYVVVLSTFDTSSAGSFGYLRNGVQSMLASRLATRDRISVLDRTFTDRELASLKSQQPGPAGGKEVPADYLVTGSLYGLKSGLNIQVVLYPFAAGAEPMRFEVLVKNSENMIADIEQMANEIAQTAFGYHPASPEKPGQASDGAGVSGFVTVHPEAAYKKSMHTGTVVAAPESTIQVKAREGKKNVSLSREITTLAVGDVDGDNVDEVVVLSGGTVEMYKVGDKQINRVATATLPASLDCHAMNMADLDNNGRMELYVSSTDGLRVSSVIVVWDKMKGFQIVTPDIPWYIRPLFVPGKGWRLLGQKRGAGKTELVKDGIYLLDLDSRMVPVQGETLPVPAGVNLFDFIFADLDGDGSPETVAIDKKERMKVYNSAKELLWVSKKTFGGSHTYLGPSRAAAVNDQDRRNFTMDEDIERDLIFVPGRLMVSDVDRDGRQEIVVNENRPSSLSILEKVRLYNDGMIVGLAWDGVGLNEAWRTGTFKGYIAGFSLETLKKGKETEKVAEGDKGKVMAALYVGHLPKSGTLLGLLPGTAETQITVYELEFSSGKTK